MSGSTSQRENISPPSYQDSLDPPPYTRLPTIFPISTLSLLPGEEAFNTYESEDQLSYQTVLDNFTNATFTFTAWQVVMDAVGQSPGVQMSRVVGIIFQHRIYTLAIGRCVTTVRGWAIFRCMIQRSDDLEPNNFFANRTGLLRVPVDYVIQEPSQSRPRRFFISDQLEHLWNRIYRPLRCNITLTFPPSYDFNLDACTHHFMRCPPMFDSEFFERDQEMVRYREENGEADPTGINNEGRSSGLQDSHSGSGNSTM